MTLFTNIPLEVASLRATRLMMVLGTVMEGVPLEDSYIGDKLLAAEAMLERRMRVYFTPREIVPAGTPQADIDALLAAGEAVEEEPGYDYDPSLFQGDTFGLIELRQKPVIAIRQIVFAYPGLGDSVFSVPLEWVRADKKYGRLNLVPTQSAALLPLNSYILSALGGGRRVPLMLQVRYRAGLENARVTHPDLVSIIKSKAVLDIIEDANIPESGSVSADGLSQSMSRDAAKAAETLEHKIDSLQQSLQGIRLMVV